MKAQRRQIPISVPADLPPIADELDLLWAGTSVKNGRR